MKICSFFCWDDFQGNEVTKCCFHTLFSGGTQAAVSVDTGSCLFLTEAELPFPVEVA